MLTRACPSWSLILRVDTFASSYLGRVSPCFPVIADLVCPRARLGVDHFARQLWEATVVQIRMSRWGVALAAAAVLGDVHRRRRLLDRPRGRPRPPPPRTVWIPPP